MSDYRLLESGSLRATEVATNLRALESYVPAGIVYSDDFNRADGAPGANWVQASGTVYLISGNKLASTTGVDHADFATEMPSADHWVEADVTGTDTGQAFVVIHGRGSGAKANFYMGFIVPGGGLTIGKNVGGSYSDVSNIAFTHRTGGKLRLELQGSVQRLYVDDVLQITAGDTSLTTGTTVGINSNGSPGTYDNFRCGPLPYTPP